MCFLESRLYQYPCSYHQRSHKQHEIERPHMYQRIEGKCDDNPHIDIPALGEAALHIAAPENLLGRTDDKQEQHADEGRGCAALHAINHVDLGAGKAEQQLRHLVAHPEHAPQHQGVPRALLFREGLLPYAETVAGGRRLCKAVRRAVLLSSFGSAAGTLLAFYLVFQQAYSLLTPLALLVFLLET